MLIELRTDESIRTFRDNLYGTIRASNNNKLIIHDNETVRVLTPIEYERLQGFPDNWVKYGIMDGKKVVISDTQRYKCCGNAVTTNVITEIIKRF